MVTFLKSMRILLEFFSNVASPKRIEPFSFPFRIMALMGALLSLNAIRLSKISALIRSPMRMSGLRIFCFWVGRMTGDSSIEMLVPIIKYAGRLPVSLYVGDFIFDFFSNNLGLGELLINSWGLSAFVKSFVLVSHNAILGMIKNIKNNFISLTFLILGLLTFLKSQAHLNFLI